VTGHGPLSGVIFDMDGLLVDSEPYWEASRRAYASEQGCAWTLEDEHSVKGHNSREWAEKMRLRCRLDGSLEVIIAGVTAHMERAYQGGLPLLPGAVEAVRRLGAVYPLGLASSSPRALIEWVLTEAGILAAFAALVSADEVGHGKPAPDVFVEAARRMGCDVRRMAIFEDSSAGLRAAHAAGALVVAVPNPNFPPTKDALALADITLDSLEAVRQDLLTGSV
jgi:HAD superfamily hydrolase (TIGR01509 family)